MNKQRLRELDAIRFLAALAVLLYHYTYRGWIRDGMSDVAFPEIAPVTRFGFLGVDLFFIVSGFVILLSSQGRTAFQFANSRFSRLFPAYWAAIAFSALAIVTLSDGRFTFAWRQVLLNLTMVQEYLGAENLEGVYWTLLVELKFYFWIFVLLAFGWLGRIEKFLSAWIVVTAVYLMGFEHSLIYHAGVPKWSGYFISGCAFYLAYRDGWRWSYLALLCASAGLVYWNLALRTSDVPEFFFQGSIVGGFYLLFALIVKRSCPLSFGGWTTALGALTYPLYLTHEKLGYMLFNKSDGVNRWLALAGISTIAIGLAYAIHRWVERPVAPRLRWQGRRADAATDTSLPSTT